MSAEYKIKVKRKNSVKSNDISFYYLILLLYSTFIILCVVFLGSDPDPRLAPSAQHEEQAGEHDQRSRTEEDSHGCDPGPAGPAGGENQQDPGFHREQDEGLSG